MILDAPPCLPAKQIRDLVGSALAPRPRRGLGVCTRGRHGEELGANVDEMPQENLAALELLPMAGHGAEQRSRQAVGRSIHVAPMPGQAPHGVVSLRQTAPQQLGRIPPTVESHEAGRGAQLARPRQPVAQHPHRRTQMRVQRLTGQKQPHDLRRPLDDRVDAAVAHHAFHGIRGLAAGPK